VVPDRDPVDGQQRMEVVFHTGDRGGELAPVGVDQPVRGGSRGIERRGVAHRIQVRHDLGGGLVGQLGPDIGQPMEQLLHHQPGHRFDQRGNDIAATIHAVVNQLARVDPVLVEWKRGIEQIASCPNVVAKLGGTVLPHLGLGWDTADRPRTSDEYLEGQRLYYEHMLESFGPDRCMFESNFSVDQFALNYRTLWNAYKKLTRDFSPSERADLFEGTATRVYRL
jgi:Amidohydrolase